MAKMQYISIPSGLLHASCDATDNIHPHLPLPRLLQPHQFFLYKKKTNHSISCRSTATEYITVFLCFWLIPRRNCLHPNESSPDQTSKMYCLITSKGTDQAVIAAVVLSSCSTWHPIHIQRCWPLVPLDPKSRTHGRGTNYNKSALRLIKILITPGTYSSHHLAKILSYIGARRLLGVVRVGPHPNGRYYDLKTAKAVTLGRWGVSGKESSSGL